MSPDPEAVIPFVVAATMNALQAASKHASVKRFVLTSSSSAALLPPLNEKVIVTEGMRPEKIQALDLSTDSGSRLVER